MPFKSKAQVKFMYAKHPAIAARWRAEHSNQKLKKLPKKKKKK